MSTQQEWQAKVDEDFPHGALIGRTDWIDSDGLPRWFRTAAVTVLEMTDTGLPVLQVWLDTIFEKDARITVLSYDVKKGIHLVAKIRTSQPKVTWTFSDNIPAKVWDTPYWTALRIAQRAVPLGQEVPPDVAKLLPELTS